MPNALRLPRWLRALNPGLQQNESASVRRSGRGVITVPPAQAFHGTGLHPSRLPALQPALVARAADRRDRLGGGVHRTADIAVGHRRLNLTLLFSANVADRFRQIYEAEAGRKVDAQWDVHSLLATDPTGSASCRARSTDARRSTSTA